MGGIWAPAQSIRSPRRKLMPEEEGRPSTLNYLYITANCCLDRRRFVEKSGVGGEMAGHHRHSFASIESEIGYFR